MVVCAGIFRVFGQEVAELPLVATNTDCQGQVIYFTSAMNLPFSIVFLNLRNYLKSNIFVPKMLLFSFRATSSPFFPALRGCLDL